MESFKEFLTEARLAPLFHATGISSAKGIVEEGGFRPLTKHWNHKLLKAVKGKEIRDTDPKTKGISLTRNLRFARNWSNIIFEFDQDKLSRNYKIIPVNYFVDNTEMVSSRLQSVHGEDLGGGAYNEYEEFVVTNKNLPLSYVKKVYLPRHSDPEVMENFYKFSNVLHMKGIDYEWQDTSKLFKRTGALTK